MGLNFFCTRRENTVLRGQLFEKDEENPSEIIVRRSVYVIPNALVAEQFQPHPLPLADTSKHDLFKLL